MKITGTNKKGWLVQMSSEEIIEIIGRDLMKDKSCQAKYGDESMINWFMIHETEVDICSNFRKLRNYSKMAMNNDSYNSVRAQLEDMLENLTPIEELIDTMSKKLREENI